MTTVNIVRRIKVLLLMLVEYPVSADLPTRIRMIGFVTNYLLIGLLEGNAPDQELS